MTHDYEKDPVVVEKRRPVRRSVKYKPQVRAKIAEAYTGLSRRDIRSQGHPVDWKDEKVWEEIRNQGCYHKSDEIIVSCGTVTINKPDGPCPKVLAVYNKKIGIYQLPKGRKNIGEGHIDTAMRETTEETGIAVRPLRLRFGSRSTPPRLATANEATACSPEDPGTGITKSLSNEIIGYVKYICIFGIFGVGNVGVADVSMADPDPATGAWRNIHWYAAKPCDDIERDEACMPLQDDREKFSTFWFSETEALAMLKLDDEKFMVRVAFEYTRNMSADDWLSNEDFERREDLA
ncbi:hypothetical protein F5Y14DRAFT_456002 [Nemania sp. NC0429]|nr:hypothetical protein F5Y14DRAFT_456002 [Nemania sp. NC0429]